METLKDVVKKLQDSWVSLSLFEKVLVVALVWAVTERIRKGR